MRILLIDDDTELCDLLTEYLEQEGFAVSACHEAQQGLTTALAGDHSFLILDVMLPGFNGFDLLRKIRQASTVPVLMLTAPGDEVDRIVGLELGPMITCPSPSTRVNWWPGSGPSNVEAKTDWATGAPRPASCLPTTSSLILAPGPSGGTTSKSR
jgi:Response regulators consisting of a CheY-like receiver domain and a winged-helix DNA-binding domain